MIKKDRKRSDVEAFFGLLRDRFGDRLRPEELEEVRKGVEDILDFSEALRSIRLENWDEPFCVFKPYRKEG